MSGKIYVDEEEPRIDTDDLPFPKKDVQIRQDKWITDEYDIFEVLGRGKFGVVSRCTEKTSNKDFAAKLIPTPTLQDQQDVEHELEIMKKLQHRRLLQLYDAFGTRDEMCLVLEVILGGELFDRVICEDFVLTEKACICFMRQICEGLDYMHSVNIIHLDMKPENILCLSKTGNRIKIIDFGLAREYAPEKDLRVLFGTPEFMAPEVVNYEPISFATDMWSIGVICYVLLSGLSPFMGDQDGDTLTNIIKCDYDFDYKEFDNVSDEAQDMIEQLLIVDKKKRLTARQCLEHPWLKSHKSIRTASELMPNKEQLKHYVYKRRWQKAYHVLVALKRMGCDIGKLNSATYERLKPMIPSRKVYVGEIFQKGKENYMKKEKAFNAIMNYCDKGNEQQTLTLSNTKNRSQAPTDPGGKSSVKKNEKKHSPGQFPSTRTNNDKDNTLAVKEQNIATRNSASAGDTSLTHLCTSASSKVKCSGKPPQSTAVAKSSQEKSNVQGQHSSEKQVNPVITVTNNEKQKPKKLNFIPHSIIEKGHSKSDRVPDSPRTILQDDFHIKLKDNANKFNGPIFSGEIQLCETDKDESRQIKDHCKKSKRSSSGASCTSDSSDANKDENKNKVAGGGKRPFIPTIQDRIRALQGNSKKTVYQHDAHSENKHHLAQKVCKKWQKGNDRYIVVNRVQDAVKFFTVDDQRELISSGYSRSREASPKVVN